MKNFSMRKPEKRNIKKFRERKNVKQQVQKSLSEI